MWRDANGMMHEGDPPTFGRRERVSDLPYPDNRGQTHSEKCYTWPKHHNCAVRKVEELQQRIATLETAQSEEATEAALTAFAARCERLEASSGKHRERWHRLVNRIASLWNDGLVVGNDDEVVGEALEWLTAADKAFEKQKARADKAEAELESRTEQYNVNTAIMVARTNSLETMTAERDAAVAERDRLREAIEKVLIQQPYMATRVAEVCKLLRTALETSDGQ